jgi:hypothetical protein
MEGGFSSNLRHQECVRQSLEQGAPDRRESVTLRHEWGSPTNHPLFHPGPKWEHE